MRRRPAKTAALSCGSWKNARGYGERFRLLHNEVCVLRGPLPRFTLRQQASIDQWRQNQYRTLLSVDRAVGSIVDALKKRGELRSTLIVFASDNGVAWGEHRWRRKEVVYEESIRIPFVVRYDPLTSSARRDSHLVLNIDLAPTWADLAGVAAPGADGRSLVPLLRSPSSPWRSDFLVEHLPERESDRIPAYCAVRSERFLYAAYGTGEKELYDLSSDRAELENRASDDTLLPVRTRMWERLKQLCDPPPPGYTVPPSP
jgi:N-acetylglucosamine-6-sulfatase